MQRNTVYNMIDDLFILLIDLIHRDNERSIKGLQPPASASYRNCIRSYRHEPKSAGMNVSRSVLLFHDGLAEGQVPVMLHNVALQVLPSYAVCIQGTPVLEEAVLDFAL